MSRRTLVLAALAVLTAVSGIGIGMAARSSAVAVPLRNAAERQAADEALQNVRMFKSGTPWMVATPGERITHLVVNTGEGCCPEAHGGAGCTPPGEAPSEVWAYEARVQLIGWFGRPTSRHLVATCAGVEPAP